MDEMIQCSGCGEDLTPENAAGYRCFCEECFESFPPFPKDGKGHLITGVYPNFEWD